MEENNKKGSRSSKNKKLSKKQKIVISVLSVLGIIILGAGAWFWSVWNDIYEPIENSNNDKSAEYQVVEGVTNVLLLGTDGRTLDENSRTDSMIIATLDANQQKVRLTSLYRDTLVKIPGHGEGKLNAAYAYGGHELLMKTIEQNFGIQLDKYIAINFWGFENVINEIGGIEVDVTENEIDELNKYMGESTGGRTSPLLTAPGLQKLDGQQALSYARIRKNDSAYNRDSRQQEVLKIVASKLKDVNPIKYPLLLNSMKDEIKTNITPDLAFSLAYTIYKFPVLEIQQLAMPLRDPETGAAAFEGRLFMDQGWVILTDLNQMGELMRKFIFEGIVPNLDSVNYTSLNSVLANYRAEENRYNSVNGINPEDFATDEDKDKEDIPVKPEESKPEEPNPTPQPEVNNAPVISGVSNVTIKVGDAFNPLTGVSASDKEDGNLTSQIVISGSVNTQVAGTYTITYTVVDSKGLKGTATRTVIVQAVETPVDPPVTPDGEGEDN